MEQQLPRVMDVRYYQVLWSRSSATTSYEAASAEVHDTLCVCTARIKSLDLNIAICTIAVLDTDPHTHLPKLAPCDPQRCTYTSNLARCHPIWPKDLLLLSFWLQSLTTLSELSRAGAQKCDRKPVQD